MSDTYTCSRFLGWTGKVCGGKLRRWRGTDGHNGYEYFETCERCGATT